MTFAFLKALAIADAVVDSNSMVQNFPKLKHEVEDRQNPISPVSQMAVATVTADGKVTRESVVNHNGHTGESELLRSVTYQNALAASDAVEDSSGFAQTVPKSKQKFEERQNPMQPDSHTPVSTVTADGEVDLGALVNRKSHAVGVREEPRFLTREMSQSIIVRLSSTLATIMDISLDMPVKKRLNANMVFAAGAFVVCLIIIMIALCYFNKWRSGDDEPEGARSFPLQWRNGSGETLSVVDKPKQEARDKSDDEPITR